MAYKQEPCPLCGRDMTVIETYPGRGELYCGRCDLTIGGNDAKTPEELVALMDSSEHRQLQAENAKLRELCKAWREFAYEIFDERFGEPELNDEFMAIDDRMRESGMEVDG